MKKLLFKNVLVLCLFVGTVSVSAQRYYEQDRSYDRDYETSNGYSWCDRTVELLKRARLEASREASLGNPSETVSILLKGLNSIEVRSRRIHPITLKVIDNAKEVGQELQLSLGSNVSGLKATAVTMENFYDLIIKTAQNFDSNSSWYRCDYCDNSSNTRNFDENIIDTIKSMLSIVNDGLTVYSNGRRYPLNPTSSYLIAAQMITRISYQNLERSVLANAYACDIVDLRDLSSDLSYFNSSVQREYSKIAMFYDTHNRISNLINSLSKYRNCNR